MDLFKTLVGHSKELREILEAMREGTSPVYVYGMADTAEALFVSSLISEFKKGGLVVTPSESDAKRCFEELSVLGEDVLHFPYRDIEFFDVFADSHAISIERAEVMNRLLRGERPLVVASVEALLRALPPPATRTKSLDFSVGAVLSLDHVLMKLIEMGFDRVDLVEAPGQISMRGGILDIFPIGAENPVRLEFFGDDIDSIRTFDVTNQISIGKLDKYTVHPCRETVLDHDKTLETVERLRLEAESPNLSDTLKTSLLEMAERLENGVLALSSLDRYVTFLWDGVCTLMDYLPEDMPVFFSDPVRMGDRAENWQKDYLMRFTEYFERGSALKEQADLAVGFDILRMSLDHRPVIVMDLLKKDPRYFKPAEIIHVTAMEPPVYFGKLEGLRTDMATWKAKGYRVILTLDSRDKALKLRDALESLDTIVTYMGEEERNVLPGQAVVMARPLKTGVVFNSFKMVLLTDKEIYGAEAGRKYRKRGPKERVIKSFSELSEGDLVVHETHGIGRYLGLEQLTVDSHKRDYLKIKYSGDDNLYIPVEQMDMLQKYIGGAEDAAKLSKLGGSEWKKAKAKVRKSIEDMTDELVKLYSERKFLQGYAFSSDSEWQRQFEGAFPYEETPDQLKCIDEIKADMELPEPMERLLCGDVGYGKTEVALRAVFKAVMDSKQAAILVPTTILAQQHFNNISERFSKFPVRVEVLSRFRTKQQQEKAIRDINDGIVDVVVGTHRILSSDVKFRNLGLLVIDEEQRFGVKHKEAIKHLKTTIDVLTMTATPIPRTLHLSLAGIRNMSLIEDPPEDRYPIQTYVVEYGDEIIREAILREIGRDGQVFIVHNRVMDIDKLTARIQRLVPDLDVRFAHGQMNETRLEKIMMQFMNKEFDVMVCTTIIETGLDISNANTIIINDADKMGLSQLYQLRGRVGRSNRVAYAYLMYQKDKVLTEVAEKRLKAIKEFTELGAGFRIAMRDLELRGSGNLLGSEQHGHMASVGYEMYCKMLEDAVLTIKGQKPPEPVETLIEFSVDAYIPDTLIPVQEHKLEIYKRISAIRTREDGNRVEEEIEDRYGTLPESVYNLVSVAYLKALGQSLRITSITEDGLGVTGRFAQDSPLNPESILAMYNQYGKSFKFALTPKPHFRYIFKDKGMSTADKLNQTVILMEHLIGFNTP